MPSNEERRAVAAKLRELATHGRPTWPALMDLLKCPGREVAVMYLADLVEPEERTRCNSAIEINKRMPLEYRTNDFVCTECGKRTDAWFCPHCGARVVKGDAE